MEYIKNPMGIEIESFRLIQEIIDQEYPDYRFSSVEEEMIIKRVIHTSADFDYLANLVFTHGVVSRLKNFFKNGQGTLFTDTNMALSGINKKILDKLGIDYHCYVADEEICHIAKEKGITRSMAGIEQAASIAGPKVFVLGNAPTAIFKILEMTESQELEAVAVIGAPVGFVGAVESKQALAASTIPAITAQGRKGGSNVAAAIINAILYELPEGKR